MIIGRTPMSRAMDCGSFALRLAVSIRWSVTSDAEEKVPTGRRADSL